MPLPRLARRRELVVPTLAGWLVAAALALAFGIAAASAIYPWLSPTAATGGGLLVVEGWAGASAFDEAARRFRTGDYERVATTGGPIERDSPIAAEHTWAAYAAEGLRQRGIDDGAIASVPAPASAQDRTFLAAVMLREWIAAERLSVERLDVVTRGPHARRSRRLFALAIGGETRVGVVSAKPDDYDRARWWRSSEGVKDVLGEAVGWAWSVCCFHPGPRGSHAERWGP